MEGTAKEAIQVMWQKAGEYLGSIVRLQLANGSVPKQTVGVSQLFIQEAELKEPSAGTGVTTKSL